MIQQLGHLCTLHLIVLMLMLPSSVLNAATIEKAKDKKIVLKLDTDEEFREGDIVVVKDSAGKKRAFVRIQKIKNGKALGLITKGTVEKGWQATVSDTKASAKTSTSAPVHPLANWSAGGSLGLTQTSIDVSLTNSANTKTNASLDGSGFTLRGFANYKLKPSLIIRNQAGIDQFNAESTVKDNSCTNGNNCTVEINYFTTKSTLAYQFPADKFHFWVGAGAALLLPIAKKSTAIRADSIEMTWSAHLALGCDFSLKGNYFVPTQLTYNHLAASDDVSAKYIDLSAGFGLRF